MADIRPQIDPRLHGGLGLALAIVGCAVVVVVFDAPQPLRAIGAGGLALWAPGFALSMLAFPPGAIGSVERAVLAVTASLAVTVIGAILLDAVGVHIDEASLLLSAAVVTCGATVLALERLPLPAGGSSPRHDWRPHLVPIATAAGIAIVLAGAVVVARITPQPAGITGSSALAATDAGRGSIEVQVTSAELDDATYRLALRTNRGSAVVARFTLRPGHSWRETLARPLGSGAVELFLYRGTGRRFIRRVVLPRPGA